ncbi:MAG: YidC/Oxa1 family membrane protein insertase [bacterium]
MFTTLFFQPIFNLLVLFYNNIPGHDFGLAIIALTIVIKLLLYPLSQKTIKSQKALSELQPKIEDLKKEHGSKKEDLARATMSLYKEHKINPFSSCLPLLIQLPFMFAVFRVFQDFGKKDHAALVYGFIGQPDFSNGLKFLQFIDLAKPNVYLAVMAASAQYWQTKMMMSDKLPAKSESGKEENFAAIMNKQMLYMMPIMTIVIGITLPGGLTLYWFVFSLFSAIQQVIVFKTRKLIASEIIAR